MEDFDFIVNCLRDFNYPQISEMNDDEIANIFSSQNRHFLIVWFFEQWNSFPLEFFETATDEILADLVVSAGFCLKSEKDAFISGTSKTKTQMDILFKMCSYLKQISGDENEEVETDLDELLQTDTNLFPEYGPKQTLSVKEKEHKIKEFEQEIEIWESLSNVPNLGEKAINSGVGENLESTLANLEKLCFDVQKKFSKVAMYSGAANINVAFSESFVETQKLVCEKLTKVLEYIQNVKTVRDFQREIPEESDSNDNLDMLQEIAQLCAEVAAL